MSSVLSMSPYSSHQAAKTFEAQVSTLIVVLGLLVYEIKADFPCKTTQIHWIGSPERRYKCMECPDCPAGSQPSVPCGSSVAFETPIHCVPCKLGKTYSDKYGKAQCKACTTCSKGKLTKKNCTLFSNTKCDDKCADGFYPAPFIFDCFPCAKCCGDGKDELAQECASYEKKCKVRSTPCTNVPATKGSDVMTHTLRRLSSTRPSKTSTATQGKKLSLPTTQTTFSARHTTQPWRLENELRTLLRTHSTKPPSTSSAVPSTLSTNNPKAAEGMVILSGEKKGEINPLVILIAVLASITVLAILGLIVYTACARSRLRGNDVASVERPTEHDDLAAPPSQVQSMNPTYTSLEQLENENQELFDWMCLKLDNGRWRIRRDYERLAAKYQEISLEERNALHDELQSKGSPSKSLMSLLRARYPDLPLSQFVESLKEIRRNDIAQKLMPYVRQNTGNSLAL